MLAEEPSNPVAVHNELPAKPRILLVDDTESVLESLKMILITAVRLQVEQIQLVANIA